MALLLNNNTIFLHIPKTGGDWVTNATSKVGVVKGVYHHKHAGFDRVVLNDPTHWCNKKWGRFDTPPKAAFTFCFVREPLEWLVSYWRYMVDIGAPKWASFRDGKIWHPNVPIDECWDTNFNKFVENVESKRPGYVTELFALYTPYQVGFIGKQERLVDDLITVLDMTGQRYNKEALRNVPKNNASKTPRPLITDETRELVTTVERAAYLRYGYDYE